ncbi:AlpA family transcriptional regulator [Methylobacterium sp. R2-1]|uniref:helix-turn-helix transcriptional regulator n=1 Tax=Methylobacterium sp. R2-1 TaxID=2587064 RepID=UPI00161C87AE|nr:AlpA family phage regulatory protein [Methylobacterium sp. R2-1]MBB2963514.1 putative DNA-binding transcriptional regulator AlpA [Methylobacterium sp. R2-1]
MNYHPELPASGFVTPQWVKRRYSISNSTMYSWLAQDYLPKTYRVGPRAVRFRVEDIREFEAKLLSAGKEG